MKCVQALTPSHLLYAVTSTRATVASYLDCCNSLLNGLLASYLPHPKICSQYSSQRRAFKTSVDSCHSCAQNLPASSHLTQCKIQVPGAALEVLLASFPLSLQTHLPPFSPLPGRLQPHLAALLFLQQVTDSHQQVCILGSFSLQFSSRTCPCNWLPSFLQAPMSLYQRSLL